MKITFYNRPYHLAHIVKKGKKSSFPEKLIDLCMSPPEFCIVVLAPLSEEDGDSLADESWFDFLSKFDPDFITYATDIGSTLKEKLAKNLNCFYFGEFDKFQKDNPDIFLEMEKAIISTDERSHHLKLPVSTHPPMEKLSRLGFHKNEVIHVFPDGFRGNWDIKLPDNIDGKKICDVKISDESGKKQGYIIPDNDLFNRILSRFNPDCRVRILGEDISSAFSIKPNDEMAENHLILPDPENLLIEVFRELGYSVRPGRSSAFLSMFDDLAQAGDFLMKPYAIPLMEKMVDSRYKFFNAVRRIISGRGDYDSVETSAELLFMLSKRILLRGFIFKCKHCNYEDFYFMREVNEKYICRGCGRKNVTPLRLPGAYNLSHIVCDGYLGGVIATVLTLYRLFRDAGESFIYCPELSLKKKNSEMEIDIICLVDGKLVIGEAKMGRLIKDRDFSPRDEFEKYKVSAREINASKVVFSTISDSFYEIPLSKIDRFRKEITDEGMGNIEVEILTGKELLRLDPLRK